MLPPLDIAGTDNTKPEPVQIPTDGFRLEDWIFWRTNTTVYPPVQKSPIVSSLGTANKALVRCPLDRNDKERLQLVDGNGPYPCRTGSLRRDRRRGTVNLSPPAGRHLIVLA